MRYKKEDSIAIFYDNMIRFQSLYSYNASCLRKSRANISRLYTVLKDENRNLYFTGAGRSGLVAHRGVDNFREGMNREAYFVEKGTTPEARKGDILFAISGSGTHPITLTDVKKAKKKGMYVIGISFNTKPSKILEKKSLVDYSDIIIKVPGEERGEKESKEFYHTLTGGHLPLMVMGSASEFCSLSDIDCISYGLAHSSTPDDFHKNMEKMLFEQLTYTGDILRNLEEEEQRNKLARMIKTLSFDVRNIYITAFKYTSKASEMIATRTNHAMYERGRRRAESIHSDNVPTKIDKEDALIAISGHGKSDFTLYVTKMFLDAGCKVFGVTMKENSKLTKLIGKENTLILPEDYEFELNPYYKIRTFDSCILAPLDCIAMEIMNVLKSGKNKVHSPFR